MGKNTRIWISVIIPLTDIGKPALLFLLARISAQTFKNFELILIPDRKIVLPAKNFPVKIITSGIGATPSRKRNLGAKAARGSFLAFIDSDAYPDPNWLKHALVYFRSRQIAAVGGPGLTPPQDVFLERMSGHVWCSRIGTGGVGTYRCLPDKIRDVDDYPTFNLLVRKTDFAAVGGFTAPYWPGEDTNLCHDLVYRLHKRIIYAPDVVVFHHRRKIFLPHLRQIRLYGLHRGYLARILPKTSRRLTYMLPSLSILILFFTYPVHRLALSLGHPVISKIIGIFYLVSLITYAGYLLADLIRVYRWEKNIKAPFLFIPAVIFTHVVYGIYFLVGLFTQISAETYNRYDLSDRT